MTSRGSDRAGETGTPRGLPRGTPRRWRSQARRRAAWPTLPRPSRRARWS